MFLYIYMNIKSFHWIYRKKWIILTGCAVGYSLAYYKCKSNNEEFIKSYELSRDTSRPGYKSYGMNFGFKTDKTVKLMQIEEMLDTGDILLMEHKCEKAFKINIAIHINYIKVFVEAYQYKIQIEIQQEFY